MRFKTNHFATEKSLNSLFSLFIMCLMAPMSFCLLYSSGQPFLIQLLKLVPSLEANAFLNVSLLLGVLRKDFSKYGKTSASLLPFGASPGGGNVSGSFYHLSTWFNMSLTNCIIHSKSWYSILDANW